MASLQEARRERNEAIERMAEEDESAWTYEAQNRQKAESQTGGSVLDSAMEKGREMKDKVKDEMERGVDKVREMKDETKEKTRGLMEKEGSGNREKLEEYKESAAEAGRKAREYLQEAKEETRVRLAGETKARLGETEESARKQLEDVRRRASEKAEEAQHKKLVEPNEQEKGTSARENIYGAFPNITENIKEKMTMPNEIVDHKRGDMKSHEIGGERREERKEEDEREDPMLRAKEADQMTGTGFNDVGKMGGEGTGFVGKSTKYY